MFSPDKTTATNTSSDTVSTPVSTPTSSSNSSNSSSSASGIQVKVSDSGSWSGSYGDTSGSQTVDGSGSKTFEVTGSPSVVSACFQKKDGGSGTLTVEILEDGNVVETKSTSAQYGVVSIAHSFF